MNIRIPLLIVLSCLTIQCAFSVNICNDTESPLYKADANDDLKIDIISDFRHVNGTRINNYKPFAPGVMAYEKADGNIEYLAIQVNARGNSMYKNCQWRPLKLIFEGEKYTNDLIKSTSISGDIKTNLVNMYTRLALNKGVSRTFGFERKSNEYKMFVGESNKSNIFKKTGKSIRLVTHCGNSTWFENGFQILGGKTQEVSERKLLQEHYLYQILDTMNTTTVKTRLATITYRDTSGKAYLTRKAFFVEDASRMAKRCDLKKGRGNGKNAQSSYQLDLFNKFIFNNDYYLNEYEEHNMMLFHDENKQTHLIGFDYDLTGLIHPYYKKNIKFTVDSFKIKFQDWLFQANLKYSNEVVTGSINHLLSKKEEMSSIIDQSFLTEEYKNKMNYWIDSYTQMLEGFLMFRSY